MNSLEDALRMEVQPKIQKLSRTPTVEFSLASTDELEEAWDPFWVNEDDDQSGTDNNNDSLAASLHSDDDFNAKDWSDSDSSNSNLDESTHCQASDFLNKFQKSCQVDADENTTTTTVDDDTSLVSRDSVSSRSSITSRGFRWDKAKLVTMLSTRSLGVAPTIDEQSVLSAPADPRSRRTQSFVDPREVERLQKLSAEELARRFIQMQQTNALKRQQEALERVSRHSSSSSSSRGKSKSSDERRHQRSRSSKDRKSKKRSSRKASRKATAEDEGMAKCASSHI